MRIILVIVVVFNLVANSLFATQKKEFDTLKQLIARNAATQYEFIVRHPKAFPVIHSNEYYENQKSSKSKVSILINSGKIFIKNLLKERLRLHECDDKMFQIGVANLIKAGNVIKRKKGYRNLFIANLMNQIVEGSLIERLILSDIKVFIIEKLERKRSEAFSFTPLYLLDILKSESPSFHDVSLDIDAQTSFKGFAYILSQVKFGKNKTFPYLFGLFYENAGGDVWYNYDNIDICSFIWMIPVNQVDADFLNGLLQMKKINPKIPVERKIFEAIAKKSNLFIVNHTLNPVIGKPYKIKFFWYRFRKTAVNKKYLQMFFDLETNKN